jgi:CRP-like cAMP-binding protein
MAYPIAQSARQNAILAALPLADYASFVEDLEPVDLAPGQVIDEPGMSPGAVYFPVSCSVSLVSSTQDGEMAELAITGHEGLVGVGAVLGMPSTNHRAVVLCAGQAYRMSASDLDMALTRSQALRRLVLRYIQALMGQMAQSIVCSRHHSVLQRLSFWLLFNRDRSDREQLKVTHETIAHMLGVRRESITQAAGVLQLAGGIRTSRGKILIEDAQGLGHHACECYAMVRADYERLQQPLPDALSASTMDGFRGPGAPDGAAHETAHDGAHAGLVSGDRKYADIYDFAPVGLLSVDPQGRLLEVNMAGAILLGIQRSRSSSHVFTEFLSDEAQDTFLGFHAEVMSGKCRRHCQLTLKPTAQRPALVVRIDATVDEDGLENRMVMTDITEQVQQAQALAAREREQRALLAHLPGVFWIKDEQGRFVAVNHMAQRQGTDAQSALPDLSRPEANAAVHFAAGRSADASRGARLGN